MYLDQYNIRTGDAAVNYDNKSVIFVARAFATLRIL